MPMFRGRPGFVEAVRFTGGNDVEIAMLIGYTDRKGDQLVILTLHRMMFADPGDWVFKVPAGDCYALPDDLFRAIYEPVGQC